MSEIRATTISDAAGTGPIALTKQSAAKAAVSVNGNSTLGSFNLNISSINDVSTGVLEINMSSAFDDNIQNCGIGSSINGGGAGSTVRGANASTTASLFSIRSYDGSNNPADLTWQAHIFHGDLA